MFPFLLGIHLGVECLGHVVTLFTHLRTDQTILEGGWVILHPSSSVWGFRFLRRHQHLFYLLFHRGHPRGHEVASHFGIWLCTSLVANDAKQIQSIFLFLLMLFVAFLTFENHCIIQNHKDLYLCFRFSPYSSLWSVLAIFCIWYPVHSFLSTWIPVVPAPFVGKATLCSFTDLVTFVENQLPVDA